MVILHPTTGLPDLVSTVSASGIGTSAQACFVDALRALESFSLDSRDGDSEQQRPFVKPLPDQSDASSQSQCILAGGREELQMRILQSANIVRKMCAQKDRLESRVRQLEKALDAYSASASPAVEATAPSLSCESLQDLQSRSIAASEDGISAMVPDLLHRKDAVINQLQAALQSSQRQVALLRGAMGPKNDCPLSNNMARQPGSDTKLKKPSGYDASDSKRLKQLQQDYRVLLDSKISKLEGRADRNAMRLLETARARLAACTEEREMHARLLTDRLAALERDRLDWYVEKRLMQEKHASLEHEHEQLQARMRELETVAATVRE